MKVAHVLRKYVPAEWGGTETAVKQLLDGLSAEGVNSVVFCPKLSSQRSQDPGPIGAAGHQIRRYRAGLPVIGISRARRRQLESVGGNLLSFQLLTGLWCERELSVVHSHVLNRIGGAAMTVARSRRLPFVVSIHGGALDIAGDVARDMAPGGGVEWGKPFGLLLRSRKVLEQADAVVAVNAREAELLRARYPRQRVVETFHGVDLQSFASDERESAPEFDRDHQVVLMLGRIDPVKNQSWVIAQWRSVLERHPRALLVSVGAATDPAYERQLQAMIKMDGLEEKVRLIGGIAPDDPALIGLLQRADALVLPSKSETFGLALVEAWAAGTPVIASKTTGACALVRDSQDGLLFEQGDATTFNRQLDLLLNGSPVAEALAAAGRERSRAFSIEAAAAPVRTLYEELIELKRGKGAA